MQHIHDLSLHSTMFLLILIAVKLLLGLQAFTFHDVSINTDTTQSRKDSVLNFTFHDVSINTSQIRRGDAILAFFTFHDVSINTPTILVKLNFLQTLHSTMFLLIRATSRLCLCDLNFTFHDVSINTNFDVQNFQFNLLYIPRCFY